MGRNECGSNAMVTVQMTVEEYLEMKSGQFRFGVFFLKSQCSSFTDTPRETYFRFPDLVKRSIIG